MHVALVLACAALARGSPAAAASGSGADTLAFAPKPDATVAKSFLLRHDLVVQTMKLEGASGTQTSQQGLEVTSEITLDVTDTYRGIEGGRPVGLRRLIRDAGLHVDQVIVGVSGERRPTTWTAASPLKSASVVFVWVPEERGYGRHYDEKEGLEEYLGGLREDLDLRALLPAPGGEPVAPGATWKIDPQSLADVFAAGGDVPRVFTQGGGGFLAKPIASGVAGPLAPVLGGTLQGEASATWKETREENGVRLAVIELEARVETKHDQTDFARSARRTEELLDDVAIARASVEWKFDGRGTLLWNLSAGRFQALTLDGREEVTSDIAFGTETETESRQVLTLVGALKVTAKVD
ncbi:MAG TPA: hypothetical protein VGR00_11005 [Thermoanaerobaculia bacterium]|jgi:hypothetical protein|nr:hypothetical protein [Thermoanaerobaculia bacterium]